MHLGTFGSDSAELGEHLIRIKRMHRPLPSLRVSKTSTAVDAVVKILRRDPDPRNETCAHAFNGPTKALRSGFGAARYDLLVFTAMSDVTN